MWSEDHTWEHCSPLETARVKTYLYVAQKAMPQQRYPYFSVPSHWTVEGGLAWSPLSPPKSGLRVKWRDRVKSLGRAGYSMSWHCLRSVSFDS